MRNINIRAILIVSAVIAASVASGQERPKGWGGGGKDYRIQIDRTVAHGGKASASLKSIASQPAGFGTLVQTFKADAYRAKRLRLTGYVRSQDVTDWAGLWMRIDGPRGELLGFDNMQQRGIKGTSDWKKYEIVLDVPESAQEIAFGILLTGGGQVWMDDLGFQVVGTDVPTTGSKPKEATPSAPVNLNFEQ